MTATVLVKYKNWRQAASFYIDSILFYLTTMVTWKVFDGPVFFSNGRM
jgi:hypothetical protein